MTRSPRLIALPLALLLASCGGGGESSNPDAGLAAGDGVCASFVNGRAVVTPDDADGGCRFHARAEQLQRIAPLDGGTPMRTLPSDRDCSTLIAESVRSFGEPATREQFDLRPDQGPVATFITWQGGAVRVLFEAADQGCRSTSYSPA